MQNQLPHDRILNEWLKIIYSTYLKSYLKQVSNNATQTNAEEITLLLILLDYFEDFFMVL